MWKSARRTSTTRQRFSRRRRYERLGSASQARRTSSAPTARPRWLRGSSSEAQAFQFFTSQGYDVVFHTPCGLPSNQRSINPPELYDWVREHTPDNADAVFIGGRGFRAVGVIDALEKDMTRPVLTANQMLLWHCLRVAGVHLKPHGYGRLFDIDMPDMA